MNYKQELEDEYNAQFKVVNYDDPNYMKDEVK